MAETTPFTIGANVSCTDGACGEVSRVIVDPVADTVTHLVVEPSTGAGTVGCSCRPGRHQYGPDPAPVHHGGVREA